MVSRRLQPGYDHLVHRKLSSLWHELTDSCLEPDLNQFIGAACELGFTLRVASAIGSQILFHLGILASEARPAVTPLSFAERMADVPTALRPGFVTYRKFATFATKTVSSLARVRIQRSRTHLGR